MEGKFWPKTHNQLVLLPTTEIWDHIPEMKRISEDLRFKMGREIDLYTDLKSHLEYSNFGLGEQILMLSWDAMIDDLPRKGFITMSQLVFMWKCRIFLLVLTEVRSGMYRKAVSICHAPFKGSISQ